jgi:hypothetical protein
MTDLTVSTRMAMFAGGVMIAVWPALAAEVTSDRLANADKEPQNWLMNHRTMNPNVTRRSTRSTRAMLSLSSSPMR